MTTMMIKSSAVGAPQKPQQRGQRGHHFVRFDTVQIIEFPIDIFSINPSCDSDDDGPAAIGLASAQPSSVDVSKSPTNIMDIGTYEEIKIVSRRKKDTADLRLSKSSQRVSLLNEHGGAHLQRNNDDNEEAEFEEDLSGVASSRGGGRTYKGKSKTDSPMKRSKQRVRLRRRHSIRYEPSSPPPSSPPREKKSLEELMKAMKEIEEKTDALVSKINQLGGAAA